MSMNNVILLSQNLVDVESHRENTHPSDVASKVLVSTVLSNLLYYGYIPSLKTLKGLTDLSTDQLKSFWTHLEPSLKEVTGDNRNMEAFVVYKNFPKEVLDMDRANYWFNQICMYVGFPNELFTQELEPRDAMFENVSLKVLQLADKNSLQTIYDNLIKNPTRWSDNQDKFVKHLVVELGIKEINVDNFSFKENGLNLIQSVIGNEDLKTTVRCLMSNATDIIRLCAALSNQDISLRTKIKFKKFKRSERRLILGMLDKTKNLVDDIGLRPELFKKLFAQLHPGDFAFENVKKSYDLLYNKKYETFNSKVDAKIVDKSVLELLKSRPGEFLRRFHKMYGLFGMDAVNAFVKVLPALKTVQLVKLSSYLSTINNRNTLIFAPKGNWTKAQFISNDKEKISERALFFLQSKIKHDIGSRLVKEFPHGVSLDEATKNIKLQTNDQELAEYGRGTVFNIPENVNFLRSASYWESKSEYGNTWFDNSWNLFDDKWKSKSNCCWNETEAHNGGAIFSGDPTNSKDLNGRACQMIDLNMDKLLKEGVRYAVWNVLCYSKVKFSDASEVLATLQWGEEAQKGNLYEPSRAQMVFPLKGNNLTKYVAYVDLVERKLVYMDANLYGNVQSATMNSQQLSERMPAFVEYLNTLPSVHDLFQNVAMVKTPDDKSTPILYSDKDVSVKEGKAYVFKYENESNHFESLDISHLLEQDGLNSVEAKPKIKIKASK